MTGPATPGDARVPGTGLAGVQAWLRTTQGKAVAAAAAVVVVLALRRRAQASAAAAGAATGDTGTGAALAGLSAMPNTSATDQANDFQNQINALRDQQTAAAAPALADNMIRVVKFADSARPDAIYAVENGKATWLTPTAYKALGSPAPEMLTTLDTVWQTVVSSGVARVAAPSSGLTPAPAAPRPTPAPTRTIQPTPAPAPAPAKTYTIKPGGSLYAAAQDIYGAVPTQAQVTALAQKNGIALTQKNGTTYAAVYPGQQIKY